LICLFATSKYLYEHNIKDFNVPKSKIIYLDYGFPLQYLRPVTKKQNDIFTFGYIGTHIPAKGLDLLIKAFSKITKKSVLKIWGRENQYTQYLKNLTQNCKNKIEFVWNISIIICNDVFTLSIVLLSLQFGVKIHHW
jgi:glycosyltransferase involved in cell wall biosynthesis